MEDADIGQRAETAPFDDVALFVAAFAVVVLDLLALDVLEQSLAQMVVVFDGERDVVEVFLAETLFVAGLALDDRVGLAPVDALQYLLVGRLLQSLLQFVEDHVQELLSVLLHTHVHRLSRKVFKRVAEVRWVVVDSVGHLQETEHLL